VVFWVRLISGRLVVKRKERELYKRGRLRRGRTFLYIRERIGYESAAGGI